MRSAAEILEEWGCTSEHTRIGQDDTMGAMREYARELIDEILSRPELIYVDVPGDNPQPDHEALYDYELFKRLKDNLQ